MSNRQRQRIHPLVAAASVSVILVSMLGIAMITGFGPDFSAATATAPIAMRAAVPVTPAPLAVTELVAPVAPATDTGPVTASTQAAPAAPAAQPAAAAQPVDASAQAQATAPLKASDSLTAEETLLPSDPVKPVALTPSGSQRDTPGVVAAAVAPAAVASSAPEKGETPTAAASPVHAKAPAAAKSTPSRVAVLTKRHAPAAERRYQLPSEVVSPSSGGVSGGSEASGGIGASSSRPYVDGRNIPAPSAGTVAVEPPVAPRITPIYRPQPQDYVGMPAGNERAPVRVSQAPEPYRRAASASDAGTSGRRAPGTDPSLGDRIDSTISTIIGVLGGGPDPRLDQQYQAPQSGRQNSIER